MKAKIILNSNLVSKNTILHDFFCKNQISKIFVSILMKKKISNRNFSKILFYYPPNFYFIMVLTLFPLGGGGLFDPLYHESVCRIYRPRTRFTKIHDFVPFGICQDPVKLLLKFFSKKFEILDVKIFWGSSSIRKKWKNFEKFFFEKKAKI